jgi:hypothetical protein
MQKYFNHRICNQLVFGMFVMLILSIFNFTESTNANDMLAIQDSYRIKDLVDSNMALVGDDDHVWSSAPTESTNAPTPSGTSDLSSQCLSQCNEYNPNTWNLDNWCKMYWDAGCYLPDINYLKINPAGKKEVSNYECIPSCLSDSKCGPSYCKTFSHLSSSCRTGYAHLLFNSTLQDLTHENCIDSFIKNMFTDKGWLYINKEQSLTYYIWQAVFTIVPIDKLLLKPSDLLAIRSAIAHVLSGVSLSDVEIITIDSANIATPTQQPTFITKKPSLQPTYIPTYIPTKLPTTYPTTNTKTYCGEPQINHWCNNNQKDLIYLGTVSNAMQCKELCNAYIGVDFATGCCQWYEGNTEHDFQYHECKLHPNGEETSWEDNNTYWSSMCHSISAHPTEFPTISPSLASGEIPSPTLRPTISTPLPSFNPTPSPSLVPTLEPSNFVWSQFPTQLPTHKTIGTKITLQIKSSTQSLGYPILSKENAYTQLKTELQKAFITNGFKDSLRLASKWHNAQVILSSHGVDNLETSLPGFDVAAFPTASPTIYNGTPAPTPTTYFEKQNTTNSDNANDNTAAIAGGAAAAVVGVGAAGTAAYQYGGNMLKVAAEPTEGIELLTV